MNFVSNKNFYQRIGRLGGTTSAKTNKTSNNNNATSHPGTKRKSAENAGVPKSNINFSSINVVTKPNAEIRNDSSKNDTSNMVIAALTEGRGYAHGEIGLASIDLGSPVLLLSQFSDGYWFNGCKIKLQILTPTEIIVPLTIYKNGSKVVETIKEHFLGIKITPLPRRHFTQEDGLEMLQQLCSKEHKSSLTAVEKKYYAVTAASALLKYLKHVYSIEFVKNSLKIEFQSKYARMIIDHDTSHRLELLYPLYDTKEKRSSLYGVLDYTVTAIGKRFLRARILEPYTDISNIVDIQDCIKEMKSDAEILLSLEEKLKYFANIDQILKLTIIALETDHVKSLEIMLNQILLLKTVLENIPDLATIVRNYKSNIFQKIYYTITDSRLSVMLTAIEEILRPEVQFSKGTSQYFQRIHAIKPGINQFLDLMRNAYTQLANSIHDAVTKLAVEYNLQLRMTYTVCKGFHIQLTLPKSVIEPKFPSVLIMIYRRGKNIFFTTDEIIKMNFRINDVVQEIHHVSDSIIRDLITNLMQYIDAAYFLVGAIANLDVFQSLTKVSLGDGFCCPTFGEGTRIVDGLHPLLEFSQNMSRTIRNNIIATPEYNMYIITGPNMGGKTVYIKTIAILQIMAQLGCFVPARKAAFRICDRIFTRIGCEDSVEQNASSFTQEIREMEYIFKNVTANSLIIIDELCRSTNPKEGKELAWKLCLKLCAFIGVQNDGKYFEDEKDSSSIITKSTSFKNVKLKRITGPFIYITTHILQLTKLADIYFNVVNLHLTAEENFVNENLHLKFNHKVMVGITPIQGYGIALARCLRFPQRILMRASEILNTLLYKREENLLENSKGSQYHNEIFEHLEKTLSSITQVCYRDNNSTNSFIANFINNTPEIIISTPKEITPRELLKDLESQLYDLFANIVAFYRTTDLNPSMIQKDIQQLLTNVIANQPKAILMELTESYRPSQSNNSNNIPSKFIARLKSNMESSKLRIDPIPDKTLPLSKETTLDTSRLHNRETPKPYFKKVYLLSKGASIKKKSSKSHYTKLNKTAADIDDLLKGELDLLTKQNKQNTTL